MARADGSITFYGLTGEFEISGSALKIEFHRTRTHFEASNVGRFDLQGVGWYQVDDGRHLPWRAHQREHLRSYLERTGESRQHQPGAQPASGTTQSPHRMVRALSISHRRTLRDKPTPETLEPAPERPAAGSPPEHRHDPSGRPTTPRPEPLEPR